MRSFILAACAFVGVVGGLRGAAAADDPARGAVERGLGYLQTRGMAWKEEQKCASCHHGPMMIWTCSEAKLRGFAVDEKALAEMTAWVFATPEDSKMLPSPDALNLAVPYALLAVRGLPQNERPAAAQLKPFAEHLVVLQKEDGHWQTGLQPPITPWWEVATLETLIAIDALPAEAMPADGSLGAAAAKAENWLAEYPPGVENQHLNMRLWHAFARAKRPSVGTADEAESLLPVLRGIRELLNQQREDGGWAQTVDMPSDAFATGQTIFVLETAGVVNAGAALGRGREFLLRTQGADGAWPMTSRLAPGKTPVKNLEPITYEATGWAVLALMGAGTGMK